MTRAAAFATAVLLLTAAGPVPADAQTVQFVGRTLLQNPTDFARGVTVQVVGTSLTTETDAGGLFAFDLTPGPYTLEFSGVCTTPSSAEIDAQGSPVIQSFAVDSPIDPVTGYRCATLEDPTIPFDPAALPKRANVLPTRGTAISFPFPFRFGSTSFRQLYVTARGWLSFRPIAAIPPCDAFSSANVPAASLFPFAGCAQATEVKYAILGSAPQRRLVMFWRLVTPGTLATTDVRVTLYETGGPAISAPPGVITFEYGNIGDTPADGSTAFIGLRHPAGGVLTIGAHEPVITPFSALRLLRP
jgi:hypothetical protein